MGLAQPQRPAGPAPGRGAGRGRDALVFQPGTSTPKPELALPDEDEKNKPEYPRGSSTPGSGVAPGGTTAPTGSRRGCSAAWEAALLGAEHEWRMGVDPMRTRDVQDQRARDIHERIRSEFPTLMKEGLKADSLPEPAAARSRVTAPRSPRRRDRSAWPRPSAASPTGSWPGRSWPGSCISTIRPPGRKTTRPRNPPRPSRCSWPRTRRPSTRTPPASRWPGRCSTRPPGRRTGTCPTCRAGSACWPP